VEEAETIARELGVLADYGGQLRIANAVNEALAMLVSLGITVPAPVRIDAYRFVQGGEVQRDIVGTFDERDGIIRFNPLARHWSNPAREARAQFEDDWWVSDHPLAPILHEVGHALHLGSGTRQTHIPEVWTSEEDRITAKELSDFAETSPIEFVAEAFVILATGGTLTAEARRLYDRLGGPQL
jgi:hypothetical protein